MHRLLTDLLKRARGTNARVVVLAALLFCLAGTMIVATAAQRHNDGRDDWDDWDWDRDHRRESYAIGLWGDMPYSDLQAKVGVPNLIRDMNWQRLAFRSTTAISRQATDQQLRSRRHFARMRCTRRRFSFLTLWKRLRL